MTFEGTLKQQLLNAEDRFNDHLKVEYTRFISGCEQFKTEVELNKRSDKVTTAVVNELIKNRDLSLVSHFADVLAATKTIYRNRVDTAKLTRDRYAPNIDPY